MSAAERLIKRHFRGEEQARPYVLAWDLPTRIFKWALVLAVITAWISSGFDDPSMVVHKAAGYAVLTLIVYRILWGFVGGTTARFSALLTSTRTIGRYVREVRSGTARPYLGHNPAGGLMIVGLLFACSIQVGLGLFSSDGVLAAGPFADAIGETWSRRASTLHSAWFYIILGLALVHIIVNLYHQFIKRDNLIGAMVTGHKARESFVDMNEAKKGSSLIALLCLVGALGIVYCSIVLTGGQLFSG